MITKEGMDMKVLITGGAGYIGSHTNRFFNEMNVETIVIDDLSDGHTESITSGDFVKGDFGDFNLLNQVFTKNKIDAIIHFAAFADVNDSVINPSKYYENNVSKMLILLDCAVKNNIKYFVFSSSAATFGEPIYIPIDEKHPQNPINPYGYTKLIGERILQDFDLAYGIKYCSLRYFNAAGCSKDGVIGESHNPEHHLIPLILKAAIDDNTSLKIFGDDYDTKDGTCLRDYIHVDDLANAHYKALLHIMKKNESVDFNMGSNEGYTVLEIIKECERVTQKKINYQIVGRRLGDPAKLVASNIKVKKILGWEPKRKIFEIVTDAWNWEKNRRY
jgi:UDP-glucose 4-epimerase